jgi:ABC-type Na+ efflux pump permease subunit
VTARSPLAALLKKELLDVSRNAGALLPVAVVALVAFVLPFTVAVLVPAIAGQRLSEDADLAMVSLVVDPEGRLGADARVQLFLFQQFLILFLLTPITGAMALAAHSVVGEKLARTLEPLLSTPIGVIELLLAKVLGALLPALAIALAGLLLYFGGVAVLAESGVALELLNLRTAALVLLVGPAAALVSLQLALMVSSRVNDARTAQQFGVLIVLPLAGLLVAQFTGTVWLSSAALALVGAGLLALWGLLMGVSAMIFQRETILTRWR